VQVKCNFSKSTDNFYSKGHWYLTSNDKNQEAWEDKWDQRLSPHSPTAIDRAPASDCLSLK
jgi:hypothetical protein